MPSVEIVVPWRGGEAILSLELREKQRKQTTWDIYLNIFSSAKFSVFGD